MSLSAAASRLAPCPEAESLLERGHVALNAGKVDTAIKFFSVACEIVKSSNLGPNGKVYFLVKG